ncbi:MAG: hypothetical protein JW715_15665 [Sedimentisphaerales bacterium]|nr:hypothetical protein [Sedimentisphaerales bacterium]
MKKVLIVLLSVVVIVVVLLCVPQFRDEVHWLRAKWGDKAVDYAQYLKAEPEGWHYLEAEKLYEERSWSEALQENTTEHYLSYLKEHPDGLHINQAQEKIEQLHWARAMSRNTIQSHEEYLKLYPVGLHQADARAAIERIRWREAEETGEIESYQQYINLCPDGSHLDEALKRIEQIIYHEAVARNSLEKIEEYIGLYPEGKYIKAAGDKIEQMKQQRRYFGPIYIDTFALYPLTAYDEDYGHLFEKAIRQILTDCGYTIVAAKSDADVYVQVVYGMSFRDGEKVEDNLASFINNRWRGRGIVSRFLVEPTFDLSCHLYFWDVRESCLIGFYSFGIFPEVGNALRARDIGRDAFLEEVLAEMLDEGFLENLTMYQGLDDVMYILSETKNAFLRPDIGKPTKRVRVDFDYGPISVFYWRDSNFEQSLYYVLQNAGWDCTETDDPYDCLLKVIWSKYTRNVPLKTELRAYGLKAVFSISVVDEAGTSKRIFFEEVTSDARSFRSYGLNPAEIVMEWRRSYDSHYLPGKIIKVLNNAVELKHKQ